MGLRRLLSGLLVLGMFLPSVVVLGADKKRLEVSGRVLVDADAYESFWSKEDDGTTTNLELRNARLQFEYDFPRGWEGKLQLDVEADSDDAKLDYGSFYLRYKKWKPADITLGRLKEPQGMELNTGASSLLTIERSMMTQAFTAGKSWGVHLFDANKKRRWALAAVIEDDQNNRYDEDEPIALVGRYTRSPINTDEQTLQLGVSASLRDWRDNTFRIGNRAEVGSADSVVRSAEFVADQQVVLGLEGVFRHRQWQVQGEYMATRVEEKDGPDWDYSGYYLTGSYLFGGAQRRFSKGEFKRLKPAYRQGFWELIARYSYLDVRQRGLGSTASITTLGATYYVSDRLRLMLAWLHPDITGSVRHESPDGDALSARVQFNF